MNSRPKKTLKSLLLALRDIAEKFSPSQEVSILCYHSVSDSPHETAVSPDTFKKHLEYLKKEGYEFVRLADIVEWMEGKRVLPKKAVALTFDDGYADFETTVLPLLESRQIPAALFYMQAPAEAWDAPLLLPGAVERLRDNPLVELGWHSQTHPRFDTLSGSPLAREVKAPFPARFFAYPGGNYSPEAIEAVRKAGYSAAFSIKPTLVHTDSDRYLMPRNVITKNMALWEVEFAASRAVDWYRTLRSFG